MEESPKRPFRDRKELIAFSTMLCKASGASPSGWADRHCSSVLHLAEGPSEDKDKGHSPPPARLLSTLCLHADQTTGMQPCFIGASLTPPMLFFQAGLPFTGTMHRCQDCARVTISPAIQLSPKGNSLPRIPKKPSLFQKGQSPLCLMHREPHMHFEVKDQETL